MVQWWIFFSIWAGTKLLDLSTDQPQYFNEYSTSRSLNPFVTWNSNRLALGTPIHWKFQWSLARRLPHPLPLVASPKPKHTHPPFLRETSLSWKVCLLCLAPSCHQSCVWWQWCPLELCPPLRLASSPSARGVGQEYLPDLFPLYAAANGMR